MSLGTIQYGLDFFIEINGSFCGILKLLKQRNKLRNTRDFYEEKLLAHKKKKQPRPLEIFKHNTFAN